MIVDTSALVAVLRREPEYEAFSSLLLGAPGSRLSAMTYLETRLVTTALGGTDELETLLELLALKVEPFDHAQAKVAAAAFERFGKGRHPAKLNFGDCASYALAKVMNEPLLFKGGDFGKTDLTPAL